MKKRKQLKRESSAVRGARRAAAKSEAASGRTGAAARRVAKRLGAKRALAEGDAPVATTLRLERPLWRGLVLLQDVAKKPMNKLVNEAVQRYLAERTAGMEADLQAVLERVRAYRRADPGNKKMWSSFVADESRYAGEDPAEASTERRTGPAQRQVRELLRG